MRCISCNQYLGVNENIFKLVNCKIIVDDPDQVEVEYVGGLQDELAIHVGCLNKPIIFPCHAEKTQEEIVRTDILNF